MTRGEVLEAISNGLNGDKLSYYVRAGYLKPRRIKHGDRNDNDFSEEDVEILKIAWKYIHDLSIKTSAAFKKAREEFEQMDKTKQMSLWKIDN